MTVTFTVLGKPQPAGSKRAFQNRHTGRVSVVDANAKSRPWKQEVAGAAMVKTGVRLPLEGPLSLHVTFFLARRKWHYGTGKNAALLKPSAPTWPTTRPDATKLLRAVEDALTGIVWRDDAQVVAQHVYKEYGLPERAEIAVRDLSNVDAEVRAAA